MTQVIDARTEVTNALGALPVWLRPLMRYFVVDSFWYRGIQDVNRMVSLAISSINERKIIQKKDRKDFLNFLFSDQDSKTGIELPFEDIVAECCSMVIGGSDSTSATITHFVDFVCRTPGIQHRLQTELDETFRGDLEEDWVPPESITSHLPVLNGTLKETLRMRPTAASGLERVVPHEGRNIQGKWLPSGV